jgi:A/G-specific adenine glycosylase
MSPPDHGRDLLTWYRDCARDLPWRARPEPWRVMVSEFMLQQTQVKTVLPRFEPFLALFPSPKAMVLAGERAVIAAWAGLGFYRRASSLYAAAETIVSVHGGEVPGDLDALRSLRGVGDYTAAAVGSIAFGLSAAVLDGNVERVLARFHAFDGPSRRAKGKRQIQDFADELLNAEHPGDHNQAMMELGARICRPRSVDCSACPLSPACKGKERWWQFPNLPKAKSEIPLQLEGRLLLQAPGGEIAWRRRPASGLYANLPDLPAFEVGETHCAYGQPSGRAETQQRLSHRQLQFEAWLVPVERLPCDLLSGSVEAFLAEGPPTPVARLVRLLQASKG